jgi:ribosomal protein S18 acetylase RimI-like enzyme
MTEGEESLADGLPPESPPGIASAYAVRGGELCLSNAGQLELLLAMGERGAPLRTMVRGFSMTPFLRDGDVLTIAPLKGKPRIGEVVAFRHPESGRLAIHRLVLRTKKGWLAWGDNCPEPDGEIVSGDILGRVIRAERGGRRVHSALGRGGALIAFLNRTGVLARFHLLRRLPCRAASFLLRRLQGLSLYRMIGRRLADRVCVSDAGERDMEALHRMVNPSAPYRRQAVNPNVVNFVARLNGEMAGFVQLVHRTGDRSPHSGYWLFSMHVRGRYRGLGIGEKLARCCLDRAGKKGAEAVFLWVSENNGRAISLYRKLGFFPVPSASSESSTTGADGTIRRRILMRKDVALNDENER